MLFDVVCPACGEKLQVAVDMSDGIPSETGTECDCGAIPVFKVDWEPHIWIDGFKYYERPPKAAQHGVQADGAYCCVENNPFVDDGKCLQCGLPVLWEKGTRN